MTIRSIILRSLAVTAAAAMAAPPASAQSCRQLWFTRNSIYAQKGYCFRTSRAIATFGRACFTPYGRLTRAEQREMNRLQAMEARRGCPRD